MKKSWGLNVGGVTVVSMLHLKLELAVQNVIDYKDQMKFKVQLDEP